MTVTLSCRNGRAIEKGTRDPPFGEWPRFRRCDKCISAPLPVGPFGLQPLMAVVAVVLPRTVLQLRFVRNH
jgi:hypothetical protein